MWAPAARPEGASTSSSPTRAEVLTSSRASSRPRIAPAPSKPRSPELDASGLPRFRADGGGVVLRSPRNGAAPHHRPAGSSRRADRTNDRAELPARPPGFLPRLLSARDLDREPPVEPAGGVRRRELLGGIGHRAFESRDGGPDLHRGHGPARLARGLGAGPASEDAQQHRPERLQPAVLAAAGLRHRPARVPRRPPVAGLDPTQVRARPAGTVLGHRARDAPPHADAHRL